MSPPFSPSQPVSIAQGPPALASAPPPIPTVPQSPPTSPQTAPAGPHLPASSAPMTNNYQAQPGMVPAKTTVTQTVKPSAKVGGTQQKQTLPQRGTEEWARFESDDEKHGTISKRSQT